MRKYGLVPAALQVLRIEDTALQLSTRYASFSPHLLQNTELGRFMSLQCGQVLSFGFCSTDCPHLVQKQELGDMFLPQFVH